MSKAISISARRWRVLQAARRQALRWLRREHVVAVGIGRRWRAGKPCGEACVVVKVDWKLEPEILRARHLRLFPRWIEVVVDGKRGRVRVDVQDTGGELLGKHQGLVGRGVALGPKVIGSVSAVVQSDGELAVLVSGHVAKVAGRELTIGEARGVTGEPVRTRRLDHCLVEVPGLVASDAALLGGIPLNGVRSVRTLSLGEVLYFHRAATGERVPVAVEDLEEDALFATEHGKVRMQGLLVTEGATRDGDSGAMLHDARFAAVGTLVGSLGGRSFFISCEYALAALDLQLA